MSSVVCAKKQTYVRVSIHEKLITFCNLVNTQDTYKIRGRNGYFKGSINIVNCSVNSQRETVASEFQESGTAS